MGAEHNTSLPDNELVVREQIVGMYKQLQDRAEHITYPEMRAQFTNYLAEHLLNIDFFTLVPEDKFDERVAESTPQGPSASTRDNLIHMISNTNDRVNGFASRSYAWNKTDPRLYELSKEELLLKLIDADTRLLNLSAVFGRESWLISMPKGESLSVTQFIASMVPHQTYHQGIHLALMDKLGMPRPESYRNRWGD